MLDLRRSLSLLLPLSLAVSIIGTSSIARANPTPAVAVTFSGITEGATIGGTVPLTATGTIDPGQTEYADQLIFLVDGVGNIYEDCPDKATADAACPISIGWNTRGWFGHHTIQAFFEANGSGGTVTAVSQVVGFTVVAAAGPTVTATMPGDGATVQGIVQIPVVGAVDPTYGDAPEAVGLFVDGQAAPGNPIYCQTPGSATCAGTLAWDTVAHPGKHTLQVWFQDSDENTVLGPLVTVTAFNQGPLVTITQPGVRWLGNGVAELAATGTVDPHEQDTAKDLQLLVDKVPYGPAQPCPAGPSCSAAFSWNSAGLTGLHTLTVRFDTARASATAISLAGIPATPAISVVTPAVVNRGAQASVTGAVTEAGGFGRYPVTVQVTFAPAGAAATSVTVDSGADNSFTAIDPQPIRSNTTVTVTFGSTTRQTLIPVNAPIACSVPTHIRHKLTATVVCRIPGLPDGAGVRLSFLHHGVHALALAKAKRGVAHLTFRLASKLRYPLQLWASVPANRVYTATTSHVYKLRVT